MIKRWSLLLLILGGIPTAIDASWEILNLPTDRGFTAIWAINEQTVFVSGNEGLWKAFNGKDWVVDSGYQTSMIYFVDDTLGFLNGEILTTDGGKTWQKGDTVNGHGIQQVFFPAGQSFLGYGVPYIGKIRKTTDGGWHWSELPPFPDVYPGFEEDIPPYRICFPSDPDTGYVTATCTKIINDSTFEFHTGYFKTTNGGETWVLNEEALWNDNFNPGHIDFPQNATVGYMAGAIQSGEYEFEGYVYKTINGGATWDTVLKDRPYIVSMCFPENDQVGYVFGDSVAHKTTDGGKTWKQAVITQDSTFYECHFINNRVGFVTGHKNMPLFSMPYDPGFVLKTTDGLLGIAEGDWVDAEPELVELNAPCVFSNELVINYGLREPGRLKASLYDAAGREIGSQSRASASLSGSLVFGSAGLASGVYFVRVEFSSTLGNQIKTIRAVKVR